jgi:dGTP triphosphohydrolase
MIDEETETSLAQDQDIDLYSLHEELRKQPNLFYKWAKRYAKAKAETFKVEERLKVVRAETRSDLDRKRAEIDADIRSDPEKYGYDKKPTEDAIRALIVKHEDYRQAEKEIAEKVQNAVEEVAQAIEDENVMEAAKVAMSHKKSSLEKEVELFLGGYYADPKVPKEYREKVKEEFRDEQNKSLSDSPRLRRRKKRQME